jgi:hypothetical protein
MDTLFQSLALFLPILAANQGPGFARKWGLPLGAMPVSRQWLGGNKTVAAYYMGPLLGMGTVVILSPGQGHCFAGAMIGLGAVLGDHAKSFIKRRLPNRPPGSPWFPDRFDFALGGGVAAWCAIPWVTLWHVALIVCIAIPVHYAGNKISYKYGYRDTSY